MSKTTSVVPSRSATPLPGRPKGVGGATSDGEATAGEASDGGLKLKKKIKLKSGTGATGTPSGSRAGSPAPPSMSPFDIDGFLSFWFFADAVPQTARVSLPPKVAHPLPVDRLLQQHSLAPVPSSASSHPKSSRPSTVTPAVFLWVTFCGCSAPESIVLEAPRKQSGFKW